MVTNVPNQASGVEAPSQGASSLAGAAVPKSWKGLTIDILTLLGRWALAGLFLYMGLNKALHPVEFLKLVRQYDLVNNYFLLNSIASALPWFEVFCGLLLLFGFAVRGSALVVLGMLVPFTAVVFKRALTIAGAQGIAFCAVKFDCGCGTGEVYICQKLIENGLMILFSCWLLAGHGRQLSARFDLARAQQR